MSTKIRTQEEIAARVKALESMLIEQGVMTTQAIDRLVEIYEHEVGPQLGARVVAKAWSDPGFKARLIEDATEACQELGISGLQGEDMVVVENSDTAVSYTHLTLPTILLV